MFAFAASAKSLLDPTGKAGKAKTKVGEGMAGDGRPATARARPATARARPSRARPVTSRARAARRSPLFGSSRHRGSFSAGHGLQPRHRPIRCCRITGIVDSFHN